MTTAVETAKLPWWKEPTKDQWIAWWAAWLGWTLDAFDFTVFLLIMVPISQEFGVPLTAVAFVLTATGFSSRNCCSHAASWRSADVRLANMAQPSSCLGTFIMGDRKFESVSLQQRVCLCTQLAG